MIKRYLKEFGTHLLAKKGRGIVRMPLAQYLRQFEIDCVLDVGANVGQYGNELRNIGYRGRIESFEPMANAFSKLSDVAKKDPTWKIYNYALGNEDTDAEINISANGPSSSFLELSENVKDTGIGLDYVDSETVHVSRLDSVFSETVGSAKNVFLKIDTQGFERNVIEGANNSLARITGVQMEVALSAHYEGEALIEEMLGMMRERGFNPWWVYHGFRNNKTLQMIQVDVFFIRQEAIPKL